MASGPVFVVSSGRCGSTLVSSMLNVHPDVLSVSEFFTALEPELFPSDEPLDGAAMWRFLTRPRRPLQVLLAHHLEPEECLYPLDGGGRFDRRSGLPPLSFAVLPHLTQDPDGLYDEVEGFMASRAAATGAEHDVALFEWLAARFGRTAWVERSGGTLIHLPTLIARFPGARFVHLYRDGRESALSMSRHPVYQLVILSGELERMLGFNPYFVARPMDAALEEPWAHIVPDDFDPAAFRAAAALVPLERYGRHWAGMIMRGLRVLRNIEPERVLSMSFENLMAEPEGELIRLAEFIEVDAPTSWLDEAASLRRPAPLKWQSLPGPQREHLEAACGMAMARLYAEDPAPLPR